MNGRTITAHCPFTVITQVQYVQGCNIQHNNVKSAYVSDIPPT